MKMKHLSYLAAGAMLFGLWSCSNEDGPIQPGQDTTGDVFAKLTLKLPQTRSETTEPGEDVPSASDAGTEVGKDYENNVNNIVVLLASYDKTANQYTYVASSQTSDIMNDTQSTPQFSVQFQSEELEKFVSSGEGTDTENKEVYVFVYANPTLDLINSINSVSEGGTFADIEATLNEEDKDALPWTRKENFLMTNALLTRTEIPNYKSLVVNNNTKEKGFDLGQVKVERVVSRFDYMPTSVDAENNIPAVNTFTIKDVQSGHAVANIEIQALALFNEANDFYYLPRMTDNEDWMIGSDIRMCGYETPNSFVVSPWYTEKVSFAAMVDAANNNVGVIDQAYSAISSKYYYNFTQSVGSLSYTEINTLTEEDNDNGWTSSVNNHDYKIWRYATENTLPQTSSTDAQKHGISTGVAFRGEIKALSESEEPTPSDGSYSAPAALRQAMKDGRNLFAFSLDGSDKNIVMLGSAKDVWYYAYTYIASDVRTQFMAAVNAGKFSIRHGETDLTSEAEIFPTFKTIAEFQDWYKDLSVSKTNSFNNSDGVLANYRFLAYAPTKDASGNNHYYVYYRYYNRHNDNGLPYEMGKMEFATVRNNIYKLRVNTITGFGTPGDLKENPGTDDETPDIFFKVSVEVIDWVVRENPIDL